MHSPATLSIVQDISDTARWVACFRALESKRPDALFRDPYAERLAGERGFWIANNLQNGNKHEWAWIARTYLFDKFLLQAVANGADLILNLAAGLDARPYRLQLPRELRWIEVDLPEIISYKQEILAGETANCDLERISLDLSNEIARREFLEQLSREKRHILVLTEGLLIYFTPEQVVHFAKDLAATGNIRHWVIDLASPGQLKLMQRSTGKQLSEAGAAFKFGPAEGAEFFLPCGWRPKDVLGLLKTAAELNRAPFELLSLLPEPRNKTANYPWTGVCLLERY